MGHAGSRDGRSNQRFAPAPRHYAAPIYGAPNRQWFPPGNFRRGRGTARGKGRAGRARPSQSINKQELRVADEDINMLDAPMFSDAASMFSLGSSSHAGPSVLSASTSESASTSAQIAMSPGSTRSISVPSTLTDASIVEIEDIAAQLANGMDGIDIRSIVNGGEGDDVVFQGKGKGVARPEEPKKNPEFE